MASTTSWRRPSEIKPCVQAVEDPPFRARACFRSAEVRPTAPDSDRQLMEGSVIRSYVPENSVLRSTLFCMSLVPTESKDDFVKLRMALVRDIAPKGVLEEIFVAELATHMWELGRLRQCRARIEKMAFQNALIELHSRIENVVHEDLLAKIQLDEEAVGAQATQAEFEDLRQLDELISLERTLRDKLIRDLVKDRKGFAMHVEASVDRLEERMTSNLCPGRR
ncbi:hypothetical protein ABIC03_002221 [Bradyrhizobium sp. RT6a]|uniref:hypothetical protein n=1 Tax=Bradyrhizobium sp. RT6a TaxID=3156381 RepID=UPI003397574B